MKDSEVEKYGEAFRALDRNGDGLIGEEELLAGLKKVMPEEKAVEDAKKVMEKVDKNRNGSIDYTEFLLFSFSQGQMTAIDHLNVAFRSLDIDGSGGITVDELQKFFVVKGRKKVDGEWKKILEEFDTSGNGKISFGEFQAAMSRAANS